MEPGPNSFNPQDADVSIDADTAASQAGPSMAGGTLRPRHPRVRPACDAAVSASIEGGAGRLRFCKRPEGEVPCSA